MIKNMLKYKYLAIQKKEMVKIIRYNKNMRKFLITYSSIVGSGIFLIPYTLGQYGYYGIIGFIFVIFMFIYLAYVFTLREISLIELLNQYLPRKIVQFLLITYWIIGATSTLIVLNEITIYLSGIIPISNEIIQIILVGIFTIINLFGIKNSIMLEGVFTFFKSVPLIIIPLMVFTKYSMCTTPVVSKLSFTPISQSAWCFVGIEAGTLLDRSQKSNILIYSIIFVGLIYLLNISAIFYALGFNVSLRPFTDIALLLFGSYGSLLLSLLVCTICIGTLNSWILLPGLFLANCAQNNLVPRIFADENTYGSPAIAIISGSLILIICILFNKFFAIATLIDIASGMFFPFYGAILLVDYIERRSIISLLIGLFMMIFGFYIALPILLPSLILLMIFMIIYKK